MRRRLAVYVAVIGGLAAAITVPLVLTSASTAQTPPPVQGTRGCHQPGTTAKCITLGVTWPSRSSKR